MGVSARLTVGGEPAYIKEDPPAGPVRPSQVGRGARLSEGSKQYTGRGGTRAQDAGPPSGLCLRAGLHTW